MQPVQVSTHARVQSCAGSCQRDASPIYVIHETNAAQRKSSQGWRTSTCAPALMRTVAVAVSPRSAAKASARDPSLVCAWYVQHKPQNVRNRKMRPRSRTCNKDTNLSAKSLGSFWHKILILGTAFVKHCITHQLVRLVRTGRKQWVCISAQHGPRCWLCGRPAQPPCPCPLSLLRVQAQ